MRVRQWLLLALSPLLAAGLLLASCGGSDDGRQPSELSQIATATLPNPLPEPVIVGETSAPVQGATYIVQSGDSPASIAAQFGVTADAIIEANGISDPTKLEVGQVLTIPGGEREGGEVLGATAEPPATPTSEPEGQTVYVVEAGDIPETIAAQFGISAEALMAANGITDPTGLYIGQELIIPSPAPAATPAP